MKKLKEVAKAKNTVKTVKGTTEVPKVVKTDTVGPVETPRDYVKELLEIAWVSKDTNPDVPFEDWYNNVFKDEFANKYNNVIKKMNEGLEAGVIDEGFFGALAGATIGPWVMKKLCKVLGIDENGQLGKLITSRLVLTAVGIKA